MQWSKQQLNIKFEMFRAIDLHQSLELILTGVLAGGEVEDLDDMIHALHLLRVRERVRKPEPRLVLKHTRSRNIG